MEVDFHRASTHWNQWGFHGVVPPRPSAVAGLVLAGYAVAMLLAASRTTIRRDVG